LGEIDLFNKSCCMVKTSTTDSVVAQTSSFRINGELYFTGVHLTAKLEQGKKKEQEKGEAGKEKNRSGKGKDRSRSRFQKSIRAIL